MMLEWLCHAAVICSNHLKKIVIRRVHWTFSSGQQQVLSHSLDNQRSLFDESLAYAPMIGKRDGHGFRTTWTYLGLENQHSRASHVVVGGVGTGPSMQARTQTWRCGKIQVPLRDLIWLVSSPQRILKRVLECDVVAPLPDPRMVKP
jgi:hypothetical protein